MVGDAAEARGEFSALIKRLAIWVLKPAIVSAVGLVRECVRWMSASRCNAGLLNLFYVGSGARCCCYVFRLPLANLGFTVRCCVFICWVIRLTGRIAATMPAVDGLRYLVGTVAGTTAV